MRTEERFFRACREGDFPTATVLLDQGCNVDCQLPSTSFTAGATPLLMAAQGGSIPVVSYLLAKGASCIIPDAFGKTPLAVAVENDDHAMVSLLLAAGAGPNQVAVLGKEGIVLTPLMVAVLHDNPDMVLLLLRAGADPNIRTKSTTALILAVVYANEVLCKLLIHYGAGVEIPAYEVFTAGHGGSGHSTSGGLFELPPEWAFRQFRGIVEGQKKSDLPPQRTPLYIACGFGYLSIVEILIDSGANIYAPGVLRVAAYQMRSDVVRRLIQAGLVINSSSDFYSKLWADSNSIDSFTERSKAKEMLEVLYSAGANINITEFEKHYTKGTVKLLKRLDSEHPSDPTGQEDGSEGDPEKDFVVVHVKGSPPKRSKDDPEYKKEREVAKFSKQHYLDIRAFVESFVYSVDAPSLVVLLIPVLRDGWAKENHALFPRHFRRRVMLLLQLSRRARAMKEAGDNSCESLASLDFSDIELILRYMTCAANFHERSQSIGSQIMKSSRSFFGKIKGVLFAEEASKGKASESKSKEKDKEKDTPKDNRARRAPSSEQLEPVSGDAFAARSDSPSPSSKSSK